MSRQIFLKPRELSEAIGWSIWAIKRMRLAGKIPFMRFGHRTIRYDLAEVTAALKKYTVKVHR
jgi:hypothetical protein